jgi:hypothetical protein
MNKLYLTTIFSALLFGAGVPALAANTGAKTPDTGTDQAVPGTSAADELHGGAIVDPKSTLHRGFTQKHKSKTRPSEKSSTKQTPPNNNQEAEPSDPSVK